MAPRATVVRTTKVPKIFISVSVRSPSLMLGNATPSIKTQPKTRTATPVIAATKCLFRVTRVGLPLRKRLPVGKVGLCNLNEGAKESCEIVANRGKEWADNLRVG
jgi:hypothetical protein